MSRRSSKRHEALQKCHKTSQNVTGMSVNLPKRYKVSHINVTERHISSPKRHKRNQNVINVTKMSDSH